MGNSSEPGKGKQSENQYWSELGFYPIVSIRETPELMAADANGKKFPIIFGTFLLVNALGPVFLWLLSNQFLDSYLLNEIFSFWNSSARFAFLFEPHSLSALGFLVVVASMVLFGVAFGIIQAKIYFRHAISVGSYRRAGVNSVLLSAAMIICAFLLLRYLFFSERLYQGPQQDSLEGLYQWPWSIVLAIGGFILVAFITFTIVAGSMKLLQQTKEKLLGR